jgi:hypothetical protein
VYLIYDPTYQGTQASSVNESLGFMVVDLTQPGEPRVIGNCVLEARNLFQLDDWSYGKRILQLGSTLVLQERWPTNPASANASGASRATLQAVDLSDPGDIRRLSSVTLDGISAGGLFSQGSSVMTSTYDPVPGSARKVRFYVERLDYASPSSPQRSRINVPGSLLAVAAEGQRVVTVDYQRTTDAIEPASSTPSCTSDAAWGRASYEYATDQGDSGTVNPRPYPVACIRVTNSLKVVDLGPECGTVLDGFEITGDPIFGVFTGTDRIWLVRDSVSDQSRRIETLTGLAAGELVVTASTAVPATGRVYATGTKFGTYTTQGVVPGPLDESVSGCLGNPGLSELSVYDTRDPASPRRLLKVDLGTWEVGELAIEEQSTIVPQQNGAYTLDYE